MKVCATCGQEKNIPRGTKCSACIKKAQRVQSPPPEGAPLESQPKVGEDGIIYDDCAKCGKVHRWGHTDEELEAIKSKLPDYLKNQIVTPRATFRG